MKLAIFVEALINIYKCGIYNLLSLSSYLWFRATSGATGATSGATRFAAPGTSGTTRFATLAFLAALATRFATPGTSGTLATTRAT
jgi:hypothetical protein